MPRPPQSRKREASKDYDSDGGFVEDAPRSKKSKSSKNGNTKALHPLQMNRDDDGNQYWDISGKRRLTLSEFKGNTMVSIREYYQDQGSGKMLPGKKGISLNLDQFNTVVELLPQMESALKAKGLEVPRPHYTQISNSEPTDGASRKNDEDEDKDKEEDQNDEAPESTSKLDKFRHRANHEATSDEDDG